MATEQSITTHFLREAHANARAAQTRRDAAFLLYLLLAVVGIGCVAVGDPARGWATLLFVIAALGIPFAMLVTLYHADATGFQLQAHWLQSDLTRRTRTADPIRFLGWNPDILVHVLLWVFIIVNFVVTTVVPTPIPQWLFGAVGALLLGTLIGCMAWLAGLDRRRSPELLPPRYTMLPPAPTSTSVPESTNPATDNFVEAPPLADNSVAVSNATENPAAPPTVTEQPVAAPPTVTEQPVAAPPEWRAVRQAKIKQRELRIEFLTGAKIRFDVDRVPALQGTPDHLLTTVQVSTDGQYLHWPNADRQIPLADLVANAPATAQH